MSDSFDAPLPRRSLTLPTKLNRSIQRRSDSFKRSENDLFYHPSAKVVHFAPRSIAPIPSSTAPSDFDYPVDTVETLPWWSPTERTVAFAPLRLEKVHGMTVFLKCGSVVHAIFKNSQCWCVDGISTFVLRIRPLTYYRIELPNEMEQDKALVTEMKEALPQILRYEATPCPFKRGFTVEIPEEAKAPRRRKAWRPKGRRESAPIQSTYSRESLLAQGLATLDSLSAGEDTDGTATDGSSFTPRASSVILETIPDDEQPGPIELPKQSATGTQQSFQTLLTRFEDTSGPQDGPELSFSSSVDSFHSLDLAPEQYLTPPSPTSLDDSQPSTHELKAQELPCRENIAFQDTLQLPFQPEQSTDRVFISSDSAESLSAEQDFHLPWTPGSFSSAKSTDSNPNLASMSIEFRRRSKASREREVSPMPPASTLILANPGKQDAASIIQKTCSLVLVPPIQLLIVLIHIAARIVIGPALNSPVGALDRKLERHVSGSHQAVDDYDLPLAPDCSRKPPVSDRASYVDLN
ncbi:inheritance of peroxisomes protein 1-domain-containing protein [Aspergillus cavernicola]|uniref:Inheritance of peroxisomes protein 1 n=1 Tax=Aspergillus cavernicola TaxID=176166 RepID=A0ABR4HW72_9EURO